MLRVTFQDEKSLLRIPDLLIEDVTPSAVSNHCHAALRRYKGWWLEMDVWSTTGVIHLPKKHDIRITVAKA